MGGQDHRVAVLVLVLQAAVIAQLLVSLFVKRGEFVRDEGVVLTPTQLCVPGLDGKGECRPISNWNEVHLVLACCAYAPFPLTLFAALGYLYGVWLLDSHCLRFSLVAQALAAASMFAGIVVPFAGHWHLVRLPGLTVAFYLGVGACVEMAAAAYLCWVSEHRLTSRKELTGQFV